MSLRSPGRALVPLLVLVAVVTAAATAVLVSWLSSAGSGTAKAPATTQASTAPAAATRPVAEKPKAPRTFVDVVRAADPTFPTTQPLDEKVDYADAAAVLVTDPVYLCPRGDLWITRADADPTPAVLKRVKDEQVHVTREHVLFTHWTIDDRGEMQPHLVRPAGDGALELTFPKGDPTPLPRRAYDFARAFTWHGAIVVPTATGVSVLKVNADRSVADAYVDVVKTPAATQPVTLTDTRGLLAFVPATAAGNGSSGAFRYVDDKWNELGVKQGWPEDLVHLVPLLDGSVLQIIAASPNRVELHVALLDAPNVDVKHIGDLVNNLSNEDEQVRQAAFAELSRYGPSLWPVLDKLLADQTPEAQIRLQQLLQNRDVPTLGGMTVMRNDLKVVQRYRGGGVVFFTDGGISIPLANSDKRERYAPAFVAVMPGRTPAPLPVRMIRDLNPDTGRIFPYQNTWIVSDDVQGPQMFTGVSFVPLVPKKYRARFTEYVGQDGAGRLLFREPKAPSAPLSSPRREAGVLPSTPITTHTASDQAPAPTLIVDPFLPDPTPKLPVWVFDVPAGGTVGWDKAGYPVVKSGGAFALEPARFRNVPKNETVYTKPDTDPAVATGADGTYSATNDSLTLKTPDGKTVTWPLPDLARGSVSPHLVVAPDRKLFLYNQAGRILRIGKKPDGPEPFSVEATFTNRIPNLTNPLRIWLDPAGRIVIASDRSISLLFPTGRIPRQTVLMMPADQLDAQQD